MKWNVTCVLLGLVLLVVVAGCSAPGDLSIGIGNQPGDGRGVLNNVETLNNGLTQVWFFGDTTYVYCTLDKNIAILAKNILRETNATVVYTYRDWKVGDPEYDKTDANGYRISQTCGQLKKGANGSKLLSISRVGQAPAQ